MADLVVRSTSTIEGMDEVLSKPAVDKDGRIRLVEVTEDGKKKMVEYGNAITRGLQDWQINQIKEATIRIRNVDGETKQWVAKQLYDIKGMIRGSKKGENPAQWTAFKKSGLLPYSAREIQDLVSSWEWMESNDLAATAYNTVGFRTLALIANCNKPAAKKKLEAMLANGEQVTRKLAAETIDPPTPKSKDTAWEVEQVAWEKKLASKPAAKLKEECMSLAKKNYDLKEEVARLKKTLIQLPEGAVVESYGRSSKSKATV